MSATITPNPLRPIGSTYLDSTQLPAFLSAAEHLIPLAYSDGKGIATIGYGLNLTEPKYLALVLAQLGVFAASDADQAATGQPETAAQKNARYQRAVVDIHECHQCEHHQSADET